MPTLKFWDGTRYVRLLAGGGPPSGPAGGDLAGTYPNPTLAVDRVRKTGDEVNGPLVVKMTNPILSVDDVGGAQADVIWKKNGLARWIFRQQGTETGSDTGSDLTLLSRTDAGGIKATILRFARSTGLITVDNTGADAQTAINARPGFSGIHYFLDNATRRWAAFIEAAATRNFRLARYDSGGNYVDTVLQFDLATGLGVVSGDPTDPLGIVPRRYADPTAWTALPMQGAWVGYGSSFEMPRYCRYGNGVVRIQGLVKSGTANPVAVLPTGHRPSATLYFPTVRDVNTFAMLSVKADGTVEMFPAPSGAVGWLSVNAQFQT